MRGRKFISWSLFLSFFFSPLPSFAVAVTHTYACCWTARSRDVREAVVPMVTKWCSCIPFFLLFIIYICIYIHTYIYIYIYDTLHSRPSTTFVCVCVCFFLFSVLYFIACFPFPFFFFCQPIVSNQTFLFLLWRCLVCFFFFRGFERERAGLLIGMKSVCLGFLGRCWVWLMVVFDMTIY